jgi:hypothetical protein
VLGIFDLGWAALGLLLAATTIALLVLVAVLAALDLIPPDVVAYLTLGGVIGAPLVLVLPVSCVLNAALLIGAVHILQRHDTARQWIRIWAIGVWVLGLIDLAGVSVTWVTPWSWALIVLALVSPAWALVNWVVLTRPATRKQLMGTPPQGPGTPFATSGLA